MNEVDSRDAEEQRLRSLRRYEILDTPPEAAFDRIARLASRLLGMPIALVTFLDRDRFWLKARIGLDAEAGPREVAFCDTTIQRKAALVVPDLGDDGRFADNPLVTGEPHLRFYAGAPLLTPEGEALGSLCVLDDRPHPDFTADQAEILSDLAALVMAELELRRELRSRDRMARRTELRARLLESTAATSSSHAAAEGAMSALREAVGGRVCLLFRVAANGVRLELLGGRGWLGPLDPSYLVSLREAGMRLDNSLTGEAIRTGQQMVIQDVSPELKERYPGLRLNAEIGVVTQVITPILVGEQRYAIGMGLGPGDHDLNEIRETILDAASTLRPLLRRLIDAEETELFRRAVEASADGVVIGEATPDHGDPRIRYVNTAFLGQTGYTRSEIIGRSSEILGGPHGAAQNEEFSARLRQNLPVTQDAVTYRRDGSSFLSELSISPFASEAGWVSYWIAIQRDVTRQRMEAKALAESEAQFRHFFERHPAPMWVFDRESLAFLEVNAAATSAYGRSREEFLAMTVADVSVPEERETARFAASQAPSGLSNTGPWRHIAAGREIRQVQIRAEPIEFRGRPAVLAVIWDLTERMRAEAKAGQLAEQLRGTFESISDGLYTLDRNWRFTYVNARAASYLRRPVPELLGRVIWEIFPDLVGQPFQQRMERVVSRHEAERFEEYYEPFDESFSGTIYPGSEGVTVYVQNVTQVRQRDERLRVLEAAVAKLNDIIMITEAEPVRLPGPRIVFVNDAFQRRTGYSAEEVIGRTPRILQGPGTSRAELDRIAAALERWRPVRSELLNYTKAGDEFWLEMDIVPVADDTGWFTHWVAVERDITERKRNQKQLEQQAAMLAQASDAIWVRGLDNRIEYWNPSAERLFGWSATEAIGQDGSAMLFPDPAAFAAATEVLLRDGDWRGQQELLRRGGGTVTVQSNWTLLRNEEGAPRAVLSVDSDVTERLALEGQLRQAQRMEAVGQLTGGIAHDFNNLLTVILGSTEMLMDSLADDAELNAMARQAAEAARRGSELTSRLLAFSRQQALDARLHDLNQLLSGLMEILPRALGADVRTVFVPGASLWAVRVDAGQVENAVLNLCLNARDAMPHGGEITVETANARLDEAYAAREDGVTPGDHVMVAVSDNGAGMPPEVAARAFEPFFTTKDVGKGSGLGLSMVYGFVRQSGGHVKIESEPGKGTSVRLYFPRASACAVEPGRAEVEDGDLALGQERILLVEDDVAVRAFAARQLRMLGYDVLEAMGASDALAQLRASAPVDLLFTDMVLPGGMTGGQLAEEARKLLPRLRVLFTSGHAEDVQARQGSLPADAEILSKPYRRNELARKVRLALDRRG
ncbi:PAS domain S-box protein [Roseococcus sp. YIM B11640]|uniref:PAS domain S-box protein n=1 Tax=Roseococcus sp. YIM B11640 TaxID=3133973 RepID=UPI003C7E7389